MRRKNREIKGAPILMTVSETAEYLGLCTVSVYRYISSGVIPAMRVGGTWRINLDELIAAIQQGRLS